MLCSVMDRVAGDNGICGIRFRDRRLAGPVGSVGWVGEFELMQASGMMPWIFLVETRF